jgi:hypothetical protein
MAKSEETLEAELAEAKEAYRDNLDDQNDKARLDMAKRALVVERRERREAAGATGVTIGGDAIQEG